MAVHIVLGMAFGDEGKGITTDYLCQQSPNAIVVRFSGGQQAGHTVMIDGKKHIHSSFGSGTLRGLPSYFSEHACFYLNSIEIERKVLKEKGIYPDLYIDPLAKMTTPYDVAYNRMIESRLRHGSVGLGIGTTMSRHLNTGYKLFAVDLLNVDILKAKLKAIKSYYMNKCKDVGERMEFAYHYEEAEPYFYKMITVWPQLLQIANSEILNYKKDVIFEGSQGIMLDMDHGIFPNVTYSHTTSRNAMEIIRKVGLDYPHIWYVTRCYQTRHGEGWMSNQDSPKLINNQEEINTPNDWQGTMRTGEIDYNLLKYSLAVDKMYSSHVRERNLVVTCVDQRPEFKLDENFEDMFDNVMTSNSPDSKTYIKLKLKRYATSDNKDSDLGRRSTEEKWT